VQTGPFIKLGPLRNVEGVAEISGSLSGAGLVLILALALTIYGAVSFQNEKPQVGLKTLSGAHHGPFAQPIWQLCRGWICWCVCSIARRAGSVSPSPHERVFKLASLVSSCSAVRRHVRYEKLTTPSQPCRP